MAPVTEIAGCKLPIPGVIASDFANGSQRVARGFAWSKPLPPLQCTCVPRNTELRRRPQGEAESCGAEWRRQSRAA